MAGKRVAIHTLGCKVNQYESAALAGMFRDCGYDVVDFAGKADIYIVNTCTVTHLGDRKSRQLIRRAVRANPEAIVAVTGCYAQTSPGEVSGIPGVDLVIGTRDRKQLVELVESAVKGSGPLCAVREFGPGDEFEELPALPEYGRARAYLKIQEGCSNFCTYCIVPYARGPVRSRNPGSVIDEAVRLAGAGFKEIVLTGIHTGEYGRDLPGRPLLAGLIKKLSEVPGLRRLRLSSIEPTDLNTGLVDAMAGSAIFCRHLHVPLQSGDDGILKKMGRRYNSSDYENLAAMLREKLPGLSLTTDVMAGFPGEGEEQFAATCRLVEKVSFSGLHVFKYSPRRGTPAAGFPGQVAPEAKEARSARLIALGKKLAADFAASLLGRKVEVLVEQRLDESQLLFVEADGAGHNENAGAPALYEGFTGNYVRVAFPAGEESRGEITEVFTERQLESLLLGRIINPQQKDLFA